MSIVYRESPPPVNPSAPIFWGCGTGKTVELIVSPENTAIARARGLIDRVRDEIEEQ
ncbi:hypothetical protein [Lyngbya sp. CCY1209]|uniref:hypothetical protein n=1 Tax=Lyngbya sp. CCY1209 TaxID=2886103 RepID=UPI002D210ED2|nr:hypothetical protein [Lyngbya sp. CCY1209]MEB3882922.1 hypothetical protein [Lyngbya sp. CCY1209]